MGPYHPKTPWDCHSLFTYIPSTSNSGVGIGDLVQSCRLVQPGWLEAAGAW